MTSPKPSQVPPETVVVPGGEFTMGISVQRAEQIVEEYYKDAEEAVAPTMFYAEVPEHKVTVAAFRMALHEVTNAEYKAFIEAGAYADPSLWAELLNARDLDTDLPGMERVKLLVDATGKPGPLTWSGGSFPAGKDQHPVDGVSFYEAAAYARWRGARLPSEAEWEYAARGTDARTFVWGNDVKLLLEFNGRQEGHSTPVGSLAHDKSPFGIMDMARNVSEWVADSYQPYAGSPVGQLAKVPDSQGVVRGGNAMSMPDEVRASWRRTLGRLERPAGVGIRLALNN